MQSNSNTGLEDRIASLETELDMTKGTIKKLVMDIREMMNTLENPFVALQDGEINVATNVAPKNEIDEKKNEKQAESEKEIEKNNNNNQAETITNDNNTATNNMASTEANMRYHSHESMSGVPPITPASLNNANGQIDLLMFTGLVKWTEQVLRRFDHEQFSKMLDVFELSGYIPEKTKNLLSSISMLTDIVPIQNDLILDLYRLNRLLNPEDKNLDSTALSMILNSENDDKEAWIQLIEKDIKFT